nr:RluA family pseudouridine synthase [Veillonella sp.]
FPAPRCTVHWPIDRKPGSIIERHCATNGKDARTDIECDQRSATCSHLRLLLHTGRTHQIRVHMAHLGYPLLGDDLYGGPTDLLTEQALHAGGLQFVHPMTEKEIHVKAPLPTSWERILQHCFSTATAR